MIQIEARLDELEAIGLRRRTRLVSGPQGPHVLLDGKPVLMLCSDNYLGLADHPRVREAAAEAAMRWGVGAGSSRVASGTMTIHRRLEERLAEVAARESALLFGSGFLANAGVIAALARPGDVIFSDEHAHPSIVDGCRLSGADVFVYDHLDVEHLAWGIAQAEGHGALIVSESVFAADGDVAPLEELVQLADGRRLRLLIDESHAIGAVGPGGRGALAEAGVEDQVDVIVGSLGTALGSYGAFAACDRPMADYLRSTARTFGFSTAPPPPAIAGALAALDLLARRPELIARLRSNTAALRGALGTEGFDVHPSGTQVIPLAFDDPQLASEICEAALDRGVFAQATLPAAVAPMSSGLRLTVMASHRPDELRLAAQVLGQAASAADHELRVRAPQAVFDVESADRLAA